MLLLCCTWWSSVECSIDRTKQNTNRTWKKVTTNKNSIKCSNQVQAQRCDDEMATRRFYVYAPGCPYTIHMQHKTIWLSNSIGKRKNCYLQIFTKISFHVLIKMSWRVCTYTPMAAHTVCVLENVFLFWFFSMLTSISQILSGGLDDGSFVPWRYNRQISTKKNHTNKVY